ncbi:MAG: Xaa-Pro peptidase family protein [Chloroflexota bacterium]
MAIDEVRKEVRHGTMAVDWQGRLDVARMRKERHAKTQAAMKEKGMAALLVMQPANKRYITGTRSGIHTGAGESFAVIFAEGPIEDCVVYEEATTWVPEHEHITWIKPENHRPFHSHWSHGCGPEFYKWWIKELATNVARDLKERKVDTELLGNDSPSEGLTAAFKSLNIKTTDAFSMMMDTRSIKTDDEVFCMKMAGALVDIAIAEMIEKLRPGRRENEMSAIGHHALIKNGCEAVGGVSVRSGPNTAPNYLGRTPTDRIIQPGDLVYWDIFGARYLGYCTCYYRTYKVGTKPTEQEKDWYKKTRDMLYAAVDVLKDGITTEDVAKKWPEAGYWGRNHEMLVSGDALGHGQGLTLYEHPVITRDNAMRFPQPIKKGMTLALETWYGQDDPMHGWRGGCRLESVWLVTEKGHENLYAMPDDEIICPPHAIYV